MKRILSLIVGLSFLMAGCGSQTESVLPAESESLQQAESPQPSTAEETETPQPEQEQETQAPVQTVIVLETVIVTVPVMPEEVETKPAETKPVATKPAETKPVATKPAETKPVATKPAETKPVETKPAETKPVATKPAETKPIETKPVASVEEGISFQVSQQDKEDALLGYKYTIEDKFVQSPDSGEIQYSLYDMNGDGIPELLLKYGTCEADFQIDIYTSYGGYTHCVESGIAGGHMSFGYDYKARQLVLINSHMGYANMSWYDLDQEGKLRFLIDTGEFEFREIEEFDSAMEKYNVAYLPMSCTYRGMDGVETDVYFDMKVGDVESQVYRGLDYALLESYFE